MHLIQSRTIIMWTLKSKIKNVNLHLFLGKHLILNKDIKCHNKLSSSQYKINNNNLKSNRKLKILEKMSSHYYSLI